MAAVFGALFLPGRIVAAFPRVVRRLRRRVVPRRRADVLGILVAGIVLVAVTRDGFTDAAINALDTALSRTVPQGYGHSCHAQD